MAERGAQVQQDDLPEAAPADTLNPATWLFGCVAGFIALPALPLSWLIALAVLLALLCWRYAPGRAYRLLKRSRWLLLSIVVLFALFTPGIYLLAPATREGVQLAAEHTLRLTAMLLGLALLHERLGTQGMLGGLYWWLAPFAHRQTLIVRLMLVLEFVESDSLPWQEWLAARDDGADTLEIEIVALRAIDWLLLTLLALMLALLLLWSHGR